MEELRTWLAEHQKSQTWLAGKLGIGQSAVSQWTRIPHGRVLAISKLTGLTPHVLRPDLYPVDLAA